MRNEGHFHYSASEILLSLTDKAYYDQSAEDVDELITSRSFGHSTDPGSLRTHHRLAASHL